jgi:hypothetical protein
MGGTGSPSATVLAAFDRLEIDAATMNAHRITAMVACFIAVVVSLNVELRSAQKLSVTHSLLQRKCPEQSGIRQK